MWTSSAALFGILRARVGCRHGESRHDAGIAPLFSSIHASHRGVRRRPSGSGCFRRRPRDCQARGGCIPSGALNSTRDSPLQPTESAPFDSHRDDAAIWLFSGGTTGHPKGVVQTHRSFVNTTMLYGQGVLGIGPDDVTISVPKLFFGYATGANLFFPFSVGASCVLFPERCTPDALFAQIARHRPTILINVPTMIQHMVSHDGAAAADLSSLRLCDIRRRAAAARAARPLDARAFGVELLDGLGTAEMWHIFISNRPGDVVPGTLGRVVPGFEVRLCDADGRDVADGEIGALWVKGESRAIGYWRQMDDTMRVFRGEWCVTGDMLQRNADRNLRLQRALRRSVEGPRPLAARRASSKIACSLIPRSARWRSSPRRTPTVSSARARSSSRRRPSDGAGRGAQSVCAVSGSIATSRRATSSSSTRCRARISERSIAAPSRNGEGPEVAQGFSPAFTAALKGCAI